MAMAGRVRSALPFLSKSLRFDQSTNVQQALLCPTFAKPELSRNFATATPPKTPPKEQKVKLPLALYGGSGNYASALYIAAVKAKTLDKVESDLLALVEATKKTPLFSQFMKDLAVPADTRVKAIKEISAQAKFTEITTNFLVVLAENGRLRNMDTIAKRFTELTMAHRGEVKAVVTTVIPLPAEEEKELKQTLQDILGQGKNVTLEQKIDPSILGGIVVEFSQKVFDMSIKTRARQMERFLRDPANLGSF